MSKPTYESLKEFLDWMESQIQGSRDYYSPGGQKVARNFWLLPSPRIAIERAIRDIIKFESDKEKEHENQNRDHA